MPEDETAQHNITYPSCKAMMGAATVFVVYWARLVLLAELFQGSAIGPDSAAHTASPQDMDLQAEGGLGRAAGSSLRQEQHRIDVIDCRIASAIDLIVGLIPGLQAIWSSRKSRGH
jgi:hypothetical protein